MAETTRKLRIFLAMLRCALHAALRWPGTHRMCDIHGATLSDPVAVFCSCGRIFMDEIDVVTLARAIVAEREASR